MKNTLKTYENAWKFMKMHKNTCEYMKNAWYSEPHVLRHMSRACMFGKNPRFSGILWNFICKKKACQIGGGYKRVVTRGGWSNTVSICFNPQYNTKYMQIQENTWKYNKNTL